MNYLVSILVPVYNVENFIEKCARSLFEQSYTNIEYIFINDCTQDKSIQILEKIISDYPTRIKNVNIIHHAQNKGLAAARNTAILNASGDYLLHVDSDDFIDLDAVELLVEQVNKDYSDIVVFDYYLEWKKVNKKVEHNFIDNKCDYLSLVLATKTENFVVNKFIKRSLYLDNGIWHTEGLNFGEDYLVVPKLIYYSNRISKINKAFYHYVQFNSNSYTTTISLKSIENLIFVYHELQDFLSKIGFEKSFLHLGCLNKKFEAVRDSYCIEKFEYIKSNFKIESEILFIESIGGLRGFILKKLMNEKYFQLLIILNIYKFLMLGVKLMKRRN